MKPSAFLPCALVAALLFMGVAAAGCSEQAQDPLRDRSAPATVSTIAFDGPPGIAALLGPAAAEVRRLDCGRFGKASRHHFPSRYCIAKFEHQPARAFLRKRNGWVEHPLATRRGGLYLR